MAYPPAQNWIWEVSFKWSWQQQTYLNVLHYRTNVGAALTLDYTEFIDSMHLQFVDPGGPAQLALDIMPTPVTLVSMRYQPIWPTRYRGIVKPVGSTGQQDAVVATGNVAASITKRSVSATRHGVGRMQFGPLGDFHMANGQLTLGAIAGLNGLATSLTETITPVSGAESFQMFPNLWQRGTNPSGVYDIIQASVQDTVRTMRRRTVGLGI